MADIYPGLLRISIIQTNGSRLLVICVEIARQGKIENITIKERWRRKMSTIEISNNLQEIYKSEGIPEPELMKIETHEISVKNIEELQKNFCEYCKEVIEEEYIETNDGLFCCTGCIGKYKEKKEKREAFQSIETPRDTIRRLQKEIAEYWKEIEDLKSKNQCFSDSSKILQRALEEERTRYDKLREELKDIKYKLDVEKTENYEIQKENEGLKAENEKLKEDLKKQIEKAEVYQNNAGIILPDALKIKNEARAELAKAKLKLTDLEKIVKDLEKFIDGALKLEVPGSPVYCLLKGMKEVLEVVER